MVLTYGKAIDVTTDNAVVNQLLCAVSKGLMVTKDRVADSLGGNCGAPSPLVASSKPKSAAAAPAAAANATNASANATGRLLTNHTNATTPAAPAV